MDAALASVEAAWEELGFRVRAQAYWVFVKTEPLPQKTDSGKLWLPPSMTTFYGPPAHTHYLYGTVLAAGPRCAEELKPGVRIYFPRVQLAKYRGFADGTHFGWLSQEFVVGTLPHEVH